MGGERIRKHTIRDRFFIPLLLLSFTLIFCIGATSAADNNTIYVNEAVGNDNYDGQYVEWQLGTLYGPKKSIKNATRTVNTNGTIYIANGTYTGVNNTGITINRNMNIVGDSQTGTIVNGTSINWIFYVDSGVNAIFQNLKLANGTGFINYGGAIHNWGGTLNITNCTFTGNKAILGGAIFNIIGKLNITDCNFTDNTATWLGGAIFTYYYSTCTLTGCNFINNNANNDGGAINNNLNGNCYVSDCNFRGNSANEKGGAIINISTLANESNLIVENSNFESNTAKIQGGAISNHCICTVTGSNFVHNTATNGGAIYNRGTCEIHFNRIVGNTATNGTAIYCYNNTVNAENNWWGSNADPKIIYNLIVVNNTGSIDADPWLKLSIRADPNEIFNTKNSNVIVDLYTDSNTNNHLSEFAEYPAEIPLTFTTTWGSITQTVLNFGTSTAVFTANGGTIPQQNPVTISAADFLNPTASESTNILIKAVANIYIKITTSNNSPKVGEIFILRYKLGNKGSDPAQNVTITIPLPENFEITNISGDGKWTYNSATRTITWTLKNVPVGDPDLYVSGRLIRAGIYVFGASISSNTYNSNTEGVTPITINAAADINAASITTKTVRMQKTGLPIAGLILAILAGLGGTLMPRWK